MPTSPRRFVRLLVALLLALQVLPPLAFGAVTDITNLPMSTQASTAAPNVIFGIDDSGSMDWEVLLNTNGGELWWDPDAKSFWGAGGTLHFDPTNAAGKRRFEFVYLFPNGSGTGATQEVRRYQDGTSRGATSYFAVPPVKEYAFTRSAAYNPLYYNPAVTYLPWADATIGGAAVSFAAAAPGAARSHPYWPTTGTAVTTDLTATLTSQATNWTFRMVPGMTIPFATIAGTTARKQGTTTWTTMTADYVVPAGDNWWDVSIPYYPATYYGVDATCTSGVDCAVGPDGAKLRRYEVKSGATFPSGRSYADELQNFANWFTYYRKRKLLLAAASGTVLSQVRGIRAGTVYFNAASTLTMYDLATTAVAAANAKQVIGAIYQNAANGGTPTRTVLNDVGQMFINDKNVIQYSCQRNSAFIVTDGYADVAMSGTIPTYTKATWVGNRPYATIFAKSLADIAAAYFTVNLRPDLATGQLAVDPSDTAPNADRNPNLHMTTYGLTLGALGTIYGTGSLPDKNPFLNYPTWPNPNVDYSPTAVDDLWHATINGRGQMFTTRDATSLVRSLREAVAAMLARSGADASVGVSNVNIRTGDNTVYVSSYNGAGWSGQLAAYPVNVTTGAVSTTLAARIWETRDQLNSRALTERLIATYDGTTGVPFQFGSLPAAYQAALATPSVSPSDAADVLAFLRGDRTKESSVYRTRGALLGDLVNAQPVVVNGASAQFADATYGAFATTIAARPRMIYQAANDGMLHAFNGSNGSEAWAYVPGLVQNKLNALTSLTYSHQFYVDGTPVAGDVNIGGAWRTMLVGGLRAGGSGYYALDITSSSAANEAGVASKVMWEFPNAATGASTRDNIGLSFGKPVLVKTRAAGWVVLVTSGYNNPTGVGYLFVLDAATGTVLKAISTGVGTPSSPSGLAHIAAYAANPAVDATIDMVYGGDLHGNVWRFDLSTAATADWAVSKLVQLTDSAGTGQPITSVPELALVANKRLVVVGTGQLLGQGDIASSQTQSIYGIVDDASGTTIATPRTALMQKTVVTAAGGIRNIASDSVDYSRYRGWYFDLPGSGERLNSDPSLIFGALIFSTNQPSPTACNGKSFFYAVDVSNGGQLPAIGFKQAETPWTGMQLATVLANQPVAAVLPSGTVEAFTHASDGSLVATRVPLAGSTRVRRMAWKEIVR